ncbi:hypothetical protein [Enterovibrio norvegicus]|uniref:hypothetical protein n=1 Tax=Enterovibrio norvegicus TaxID=188144 RepID=UPI0013D275C5|nr:hypothetical protein [Enterovibrio norvegicus]
MESKKQTKFKNELIKKLPFFPDDTSTLKALESQSLSEVMFHYLHWSTRQVPSRIRRVHIYPEVTSDKRYKYLKSGIKQLLKKVKNGEDLSPYLSKRAHKKGYTPSERIINGEVDSWEDKDQILNTKGFHHFHLDMTVQSTGLSKRTNEVLFAKVTRDSFHAVAIFDHSVFESGDERSGLPDERERMMKIHEKYTTFGMTPGTVYMAPPITCSGHPLELRRMSDRYMRLIQDIDPKLEERSFINDIYQQGRMAPPSKYKLNWNLEDLDLAIFDTRNNVHFSIYKGPI